MVLKGSRNLASAHLHGLTPGLKILEFFLLLLQQKKLKFREIKWLEIGFIIDRLQTQDLKQACPRGSWACITTCPFYILLNPTGCSQSIPALLPSRLPLAVELCGILLTECLLLNVFLIFMDLKVTSFFQNSCQIVLQSFHWLASAQASPEDRLNHSPMWTLFTPWFTWDPSLLRLLEFHSLGWKLQEVRSWIDLNRLWYLQNLVRILREDIRKYCMDSIILRIFIIVLQNKTGKLLPH